MSARRADYFRLALTGEDSAAFVEVYRSLRFSTHCAIVVISDRAPDPTAPWVTWADIADEHAAHAIRQQADLVLSVTDGECVADPPPPGPPLADQWPAIPARLHEALTRAGENLDAALESACMLADVAAPPGYLRLDFFRTRGGETKFIGASCSPDRSVWVPLAHGVEPGFVAELHRALAHVRFGGSMSCEIRRPRAGDYTIVGLDRACQHWSAYRAVGVNIPLLYIQDYLQRRFDIFHFVDPGHLTVVDAAALRYCFELKHVFVDLDETLIIDNARVDYVTTFLERCTAAGIRISIISRHEHDIPATLARAGIEAGLFENIHAVAQGAKKSTCVLNPDGAIFIDNEFAERLDVRRRTGIPVLDTNQLDFVVGVANPPGA